MNTARMDMLAALQRRKPAGGVPIWELEFHAWDAASGRHVVLGEEMERLTPGEQERAMQENAEIIVSVSRDLHFAAVTPPGPYWHTAPGELAYNVLPGDLRWRQFELLRSLAPGCACAVTWIAGCCCSVLLKRSTRRRRRCCRRRNRMAPLSSVPAMRCKRMSPCRTTAP